MSTTTKIVRPRLGSDSPVPQPRPQAQAQVPVKKDKAPAAAPKKAPVVIPVPSQDGSDSSDFSDDEPAVQKKVPAPAPAPTVAATVSQIDKETTHLHALQDRAKAALARAADDVTARDMEHAFDRLAEDYLKFLNSEVAEWVRAPALKIVEEQLANLEQYVAGLAAPAPAPAPAQVPAPMEVIEEEAKPAPAAPSKAPKAPKAPKVAPKATPMETDKDGSETSASEAEDEDEVPEEVTAKSLGLTDSQKEDTKIQIYLGQCKTARKDIVEKRNVSKNTSYFHKALANIKSRTSAAEWAQVKAQRAAKGSASSSSAEGTPVQAPPKVPKAPAQPPAPAATPTASPSAAPKQQLMVGNLEVLRSLRINGKQAFKDATPDQMKRFSRSVALFVQAAAFTNADMGRPEPSSLDDISGFLERAADIRHVPTKHFMDAVPSIQAGDKDPLDVSKEMVGMHAGLRSKAIKALDVLFPALSVPEPPKDESEGEPEERPAKKQKQK